MTDMTGVTVRVFRERNWWAYEVYHPTLPVESATDEHAEGFPFITGVASSREEAEQFAAMGIAHATADAGGGDD